MTPEETAALAERVTWAGEVFDTGHAPAEDARAKEIGALRAEVDSLMAHVDTLIAARLAEVGHQSDTVAEGLPATSAEHTDTTATAVEASEVPEPTDALDLDWGL